MHSQAHAGCDPRYNFREKGDSTLTTRTLGHNFVLYNTLETLERALLNSEA